MRPNDCSCKAHNNLTPLQHPPAAAPAAPQPTRLFDQHEESATPPPFRAPAPAPNRSPAGVDSESIHANDERVSRAITDAQATRSAGEKTVCAQHAQLGLQSRSFTTAILNPLPFGCTHSLAPGTENRAGATLFEWQRTRSTRGVEQASRSGYGGWQPVWQRRQAAASSRLAQSAGSWRGGHGEHARGAGLYMHGCAFFNG